MNLRKSQNETTIKFINYYIKIGLVLIITLSSINAASAYDYYMSVDGKDSNIGNLSLPWATLNKAAATMVAGDTLWIMDGTYYNQSGSVANNGTASNHIIFSSYKGGTPIFVDNTSSPTPVLLKIFNKAYIDVIGNFYIKGNNTSTYRGYGNAVLVADGAHDILVKNIKTRDTAGGAIVVQYLVYNVLVENNEIINAGWNSIGLYGVNPSDIAHFNRIHDIIIRNNTIHDFYIHNGIDLWSDVENITIDSNTIYNTSQIPIYVHEGVNGKELNKNITIKNNKIFDSSSAMRIISTTEINITNNTLVNINGMSLSISFDLEDGAGPSYGIMDSVNIRDNFFSNSTDASIKLTSSNASRIDIGTAIIENNTFIKGGTKTDNIETKPYTGHDVILRNNHINPSATPFFEYENLVPITIEYTNGIVWSKTWGNTNYIITHYSNGTSILKDTSTGYGTRYVAVRNMTVFPDNQPVTMLINSYNLNNPSNLVTFTAASTNGNNVDFTMWSLKPNNYYLIKKDGIDYTTVPSDPSGKIQFSNKDWPAAQTFTVVEGSPAPSPTPAPITGPGSVSGKTVYVNQMPIPDASITLYYQNGVPYGQTTNSSADGRFQFNSIPAGSYYVEISKPLYLTNKSAVFNVDSSANVDIGALKMIYLDINGDGVIDIRDINLIGQHFGESGG